MQKLVQIYWLGNVAVCMRAITPFDVLTRRRRAQDNYGNRLQFLIHLDLLQYLTSVLFGEIEIEQDQVWYRGICVIALPAKIRKGLNAVSNDRDIVQHSALVKCFQGQPSVSRIVLNQQDFNDPGIHLPPPLSAKRKTEMSIHAQALIPPKFFRRDAPRSFWK